MTLEDVKEKDYDIKAVNYNAPDFSDKRTPEDLYKIISEAQVEIKQALERLMEL